MVTSFSNRIVMNFNTFLRECHQLLDNLCHCPLMLFKVLGNKLLTSFKLMCNNNGFSKVFMSFLYGDVLTHTKMLQKRKPPKLLIRGSYIFIYWLVFLHRYCILALFLSYKWWNTGVFHVLLFLWGRVCFIIILGQDKNQSFTFTMTTNNHATINKNVTYQRWEQFHCWLGVRGDVLCGVQQQLSHSILCGYNLSNANSGGVRTVCKNKQQKCMYIRQMLTCGSAEQRLSTQPQEGLDSRNTKWYLFFYQRTNPLTNSKQIICRNVLVQNHLEKMITLFTK